MSELNRLLSDLSSQDRKENRVTLVTIPDAWGFRFARLALALFGTLAGASSITWAISSTDFKELSRNLSQSIQTQTAATNAPVQLQTVNANAPMFQGIQTEQSQQAAQILARLGEPVPSLPNNILAASVAPKKEPTSFHVESVRLSGKQLAIISYEKAQKEATDGNMKKAIEYLYSAIGYNPKHISALSQLGALLFGQNKDREAENVLRQGISTNPLSSTLRVTLARMYQQTGREESALIVLIAAEDSLTGDPLRLVSMRAALAQKLGKHDLAKDSYQWLTEKDPMDGRWWLGLAVSGEKEKNYKQAQIAYQKAVDAGGLSDQSVEFARQRMVYLTGATQGENKDGN